MELDRFHWVDDYLAHVRGHFEVREADRLLIVLPNRAVKLNRSGLAILQFLKRGGSIRDVLERIGPDPTRRRDLLYFLCDTRSLLSGCLGEGRGRKAVRIEPHVRPFNTLPVLSELAVTYRCNLRCAFCYAACGCRSSDDSRPKELSTGQAIEVLRILRQDARVPSVSFTGGEPTLRRDLEELVSAAVELGLRVNLITNGTRVGRDRLAERLRSAGLHSAQVSLEGPNATIHDELTRVPGSFDRTLAGITALKACGVHVHTNTTVTSANAPHVPELVRRAASLGLRRLSLNLIIPTGSASRLDLQVHYEDVAPIVREAREEARRAGVELLWYSPTPMCLFNPLAEGLGNKSCAACDGLLSVSPTGDVLPCSSYAEPVGSLLREPFTKIWSSAKARFFRDRGYVPAACDGCPDLEPCAGACPLYWRALGTDEIARGRRHDHALS